MDCNYFYPKFSQLLAVEFLPVSSALEHRNQILVLVVVAVALARFHYDLAHSIGFVVEMNDNVAVVDSFDYPEIQIENYLH